MERGELSIRIPVELLREFDQEIRIVVKHPWVIGIPVPEALLKPELLKKLRNDFDVMLVPREFR